MGQGRVAVLGLLVADVVGTPIDGLPPRGTLTLLDKIELHPGGCALNAALALARLGELPVLLGAVGNDAFGDFLVSSATHSGCDTQGVVRIEGVATAATMVTVHSDAERSFLHVAGANRVFGPEHLNREACKSAEIFFMAGPQLMPQLEGLPLAHVLREAKERGQTTVLDTVMNPQSLWWDGVKDALPYLDWAIPSFEEATLLTGEHDEASQVAKLKAHGAKNAAIKLGASGAYVAPETGEPFYTPALEVEAVDSLGAGDAWAAGFVLGLLRGWLLSDTARFANAVGACCVQALGATTGIKSEAETWRLLGETRIY